MFSNKKDAKVSFVLPGKRTIVSAKASKRSRCNYFDDVSNNDNNGSDDDELGAVTSLLDPEDSGETPRAATQPDSESGDVVEAKKSRPRKDVVSQHLLDDDVACLYEDVPQPTSSDVLIGPQHGELISCEGTEKLRRSIVAASMKYRACKNYMEKVAVISDIMDSVKMQNPNGR